MITLLLAAAPAAVAIGQPQRVGRYQVTPIRVVEDSRCPMNARCVWAGRLIVRTTIRDGRRRWTRDLTLGQPAAPGVVLDGVTPDRVAGAGRRALRYRFHFSPLAPD